MQPLLSTADKTDSWKIWSYGIVNTQTQHKSYPQIYARNLRTTVDTVNKNKTMHECKNYYIKSSIQQLQR